MSEGVLLDTHVLLWYSVSPELLPESVLALLRERDRQVHVSAVTAWELSIKVRIGKLPQAESLYHNYHRRLAQYSFTDLPFSSVHALKEGELVHTHSDPFDRALAAQALVEDLPLVSRDPEFEKFAGVKVLWEVKGEEKRVGDANSE